MSLAGLGMVSTFLPWASVGGLSVDGTAGGGDGYITLVFFGIILLISVISGLKEQFSMKSLIPVCVIGLLCAAIALYDMSNVSNPMVKIGVGLYLLLGTGIGIIGSGIGLSK